MTEKDPLNIKKLRAEHEKSEEKMYKLQAEKDEAQEKVNAIAVKLREAIDESAACQKALIDAEALEPLLYRPDGLAVAEALGLKIPDGVLE